MRRRHLSATSQRPRPKRLSLRPASSRRFRVQLKTRNCNNAREARMTHTLIPLSSTATNAFLITCLSLFFGAALLPAARAAAGDAGSAGSFYAGKSVTLHVGFRPGAAYDL